jgi:hypothetical protein
MRFTEGTLRQAARCAGESTAFAYISRCSSDDQTMEQIYLKLQGRSCLATISAIPSSRMDKFHGLHGKSNQPAV